MLNGITLRKIWILFQKFPEISNFARALSTKEAWSCDWLIIIRRRSRQIKEVTVKWQSKELMSLSWTGPHTRDANITTFHVNPRFHPTSVGWNLGLTRKSPTPCNALMSVDMCTICAVRRRVLQRSLVLKTIGCNGSMWHDLLASVISTPQGDITIQTIIHQSMSKLPMYDVSF